VTALSRWHGLRLGLALAAAACAGHDPSLRTVLVHYESRPVADLAAEGLRVDWQAVSGKLRVGDVVAARGLPAVAALPAAERERDSEPQTLEMLEGESGRIATDVGAPVATRALTPYGVPEDPYLVEEPEEEPGFDATARVLPDGRVRLELVRAGEPAGPVVAGPDAPRRPVTTVTVAPGAKVAVGALAREATSGGGSLFSSIGRAAPREERVLVVEVEIEAE
jgi:hypothetical protein